jgi:N-acetyl-1-D-myo-inositol-2-amino-2-deoxy-alpha-D-glucopyranoside deacetylase
MDPDGKLPPFVTSDENLGCVVDGTAFHDQKMAALAAHATQISTDGPFFALTNNAGTEAWGYEFYRIAKGEKAAPVDENCLETDLINGI